MENKKIALTEAGKKHAGQDVGGSYAITSINEKRSIRFDNIEIDMNACNSGLDWIAHNNVHVAIARKALQTLYFHTGSQAAFDILMGYNKTVSAEDIAQEVFVAIIEEYQLCNIDIADGKMIFVDDAAKKRVFNTVSRYLYSMQVRHYKRSYIEIDNDVFISDTITALQDNETPDRMFDSPFWNSFAGYVRKVDKKNGDNIVLLLSFLICGYSYKDCGFTRNQRDYLKKLARMYYVGYTAMDSGFSGYGLRSK